MDVRNTETFMSDVILALYLNWERGTGTSEQNPAWQPVYRQICAAVGALSIRDVFLAVRAKRAAQGLRPYDGFAWPEPERSARS